MAYIQKPGRGNGPKTGNGLPSAFKQIDPKQGEKPEVVTKASEKIHKELNANPEEKGKQFQTTYSPEAGFKGKDTNIENVTSGDYIHRVQGGKTVAGVKKDTREAKNFPIILLPNRKQVLVTLQLFRILSGFNHFPLSSCTSSFNFSPS